MNNLQIFKFEDNSVRMLEVDGQPFAVLKDVCRVLEISDKSIAKRFDEDLGGET